MKTPDPVLKARSRVALATRAGNTAAATDARRDLHAAKLERAIRETVAAFPPLTDSQRAQLSRLLLAGGAAK